MKMRNLLLLVPVVALLLGGCVKETYDMERLSGKVKLTPTFGIAAVNGEVTLADIVETDEYLTFDPDKFVRLTIGMDSVFSVGMSEVISTDTLFKHEESQQIGYLKIPAFSSDWSYTLDEISTHLDPSLRNQYVALHTLYGDFPAFSTVSMDPTNITLPNFEYAAFASGQIEISLQNTLPVRLKGATILLYDSYTGNLVSGPIEFPEIPARTTRSKTVDLTNVYIHNTLVAYATLNGSDGASNVYINLHTMGVNLSINGTDLYVKSGRVKIDLQEIPDLAKKDTLEVSSSSGVEIETISLNSGKFDFAVRTDLDLASQISFQLPTATQDGVPISGSLELEQGITSEKSLIIDGALIDLSSDPDQPYNKLPYEYTIEVSSSDQIIDFNYTDEIWIKYSLVDNEIDYIKGYFGEREESMDNDTLDLTLDGFLDKVSGSISFVDPKIRLEYTNSIGIPITLGIDAAGIKNNVATELNFAPVDLEYPSSPDQPEASGTIEINKTNSAIDDILASMPEKLVFGGFAKLYPDGYPGNRDSYIYGDCKIEGKLTFELPLELRINNLSFSDTINNFLKDNGDDNDNGDEGNNGGDEYWDGYDPYPDEYVYDGNDDNNDDDGGDAQSIAEYIESMSLILTVDNGFPLGISTSMVLYDTVAQENLYTLDFTDILEPASVDANGKVTTSKKSVTTMEIDNEFFSHIEEADKIIVEFTLNTTNSDDQDVKIYSDYAIGFTASVKATADLELSLFEDGEDN